ncbi:hypothetical protein FZW96_07065 [Bacillus sp. BGMRC 2118]|nr:hypothetical protein FZW96_07065 [Bacillus sp. BGMRC 2118]
MTVDEKLDLLIKSVNHLHRNMDKRFDKLEERVENVEVRMDKLENRMDNLENGSEKKMNEVEVGLNKADEQIEKLSLVLHKHIDRYNEDQKVIQSTLFKIEKSYDIKYILDKQQEHDIAIHRVQMQLEKR